MPTPRVELIAQNIATTLATITTDNGYNQDVTVTRPAMNNANTVRGDDHLVLVFRDAERTENPPHGRMEWRQGFSVGIIKRLDGDDTTPIDQQFLTVAADVMKALRTDYKRGTDSGGNPLAIQTDMVGLAWDIAEQGDINSLSVDFIVQYRTDENDPFAAG